MKLRNLLTIISLLFVIFIAVPIGMEMAGTMEPEEPTGIGRADTGIDALMNYIDDPMDNLSNLVQYMVIPFLLIFVLVYVAIEQGAGRFLPNNVIVPLSLLVAGSSMFSYWFIVVSIYFNSLGAFGAAAVTFFAIFVGILNWVREIRWSGKSKEEKLFLKEDKLSNDASKEQKKIMNKVDDSKLVKHSTNFENKVYQFCQTSLNDIEDLNDHLKNAKLLYKRNKRNANDEDKNIIKKMRSVLKIAQKYQKLDKKIEKDTKKRIQEEYRKDSTGIF